MPKFLLPDDVAPTLGGVAPAKQDFVAALLKARLAEYATTGPGLSLTVLTLRLHQWLKTNPAVAQSIVWETPTAVLEYQNWSDSQKSDLVEAYALASVGISLLTDPPPNQQTLLDGDWPTTVLAAEHAWPLYLAYVANALVVEISGLVSWSLVNDSAAHRALLLDSRSFFAWNPTVNGYVIDETVAGWALVAPPHFTRRFIVTNGLLGPDRVATIGCLLEWCRDNLVHFLYGATAGNMQAHWQYRGWPPVSRIISGTPSTGNAAEGILHRTAGCHGTNGFLKAVLRAVNVPVMYHRPAGLGHATPYFPTEDRYLSHGDDPYNRFSHCTPPYPGVELLIGRAVYDQWFGPTASNPLNNVGRQVYELALIHLPDYLLSLYCLDKQAGTPKPTSQVCRTFFPWYTVAQLDQMELWERLEQKVQSFGGCNNIP